MAALRAGALDRRITFRRVVNSDDGFTQSQATTIDLATVWAAVSPVSDGERFSGGEVRATITTRFTVRWSSTVATVTEADSIVYAGRTYGIVSIKELGRREGLEFSATAQAA